MNVKGVCIFCRCRPKLEAEAACLECLVADLAPVLRDSVAFDVAMRRCRCNPKPVRRARLAMEP